MNKLNAVVILVAVLSLIASCADDERLPLPNLPPETYVSVADSVRNPTVYIQTITWWGDDSDGEVIGFEYRWFTDPSESGCPLDTAWVFTEETEKDFNLPVTDSMSTHRIEVRAKDDDGLFDPTPSSLTLPVTNTPPKVKIWNRRDLPDTTYPAIAIRWHGDDPEGSETIDHYVIWLDGEAADPLILSAEDTSASLGYEDFGERFGERTLNLVAVDSGCDTSDVVTYTWYVKEPVGDVLLIDDISSTSAAELLTDIFYRGALNEAIGDYSILDIEAFETSVPLPGEHIPSYSLNFPGLFESFDFIIWYNAPLSIDTLYLLEAAEIIPAFVERGGKFLLVSHSAVGWRGVFTDSLGLAFFGIDSVYSRGTDTNFDCLQSWEIKGNSDVGLGDLKPTVNYPGAECVKPLDRVEVVPLFYIPPGTVDAQQTSNYYLGVLNSWGSGKVGVLTFPISACNKYGNADDEFCRIIDMMSP